MHLILIIVLCYVYIIKMENILASIMALFKDPTAHNEYFVENRIIRKSELFQSILIMLEDSLTLEELTYGYDQVLK